jgi:hypothetical protein
LRQEFPAHIYSHRGIPTSHLFSRGNSQRTYILEVGIPNSHFGVKTTLYLQESWQINHTRIR